MAKLSMKKYLAEQAARAGMPEFGNGALVPADFKIGDKVTMFASCYIESDEVGIVEKIAADDPIRPMVYFRFPTHVQEWKNGNASTELLGMSFNGTRFLKRA